MTATEILKKARNLYREENELREQKQQAFLIACGSAYPGESAGVQSDSGNTTERNFTAYSDYSAQLDKKITELFEYREKLAVAIDKISDEKYRTVLKSYYINCRTWDEVARVMNYDVRHIYRIHKSAITEFQKVIGATERTEKEQNEKV